MRRALVLLAVVTSVAAQQTRPVAEFTLDQPVVQVLLSPDSKHLIAATSRTDAVQFDIAAKHEVRKFKVPEDVNAANFSPDSSLLAVGTTKGGYFVWDVVSGKMIHQGAGGGALAQRICLSPDNRQLAIADHETGDRLIDLASGKVTGPFRSQIGSAWGMSFSPDGKWLATADDDTAIHFWNTADGKLDRELDDSLLAGFAVQFSRDGKTLFKGGAARTLDVVDLASGKVTKSMPLGRYAMRRIVLSPMARYAAVQTMDPNGMAEPSPLQVWDVGAGNKIAELNATSGSAMAFKDDSTLFVGDVKDKTATVVAVSLPK
jgi:WD40 repeat protein